MFTTALHLPQNVGNEQRLAALPLIHDLDDQLVPDSTAKLPAAAAAKKDSQASRTLIDEQRDKGGRNGFSDAEEGVRTIGQRYQLLLPANEGGWIQAFDMYTSNYLNCHIHQTKRFLDLSQLLSMEVDGIRHPYDVQGMGNEVAVFYPQSYGALHGYLKQKKNMNEVEAALFFRQIINIIDSAHKSGVALRDLKLKKFVFTDPKRTTICLSDLEDAVLVSGQNIGEDYLDNRHGCPAYVAPEMLQPGAYSGRAADMWSAGVILYTLLVGHYPFYDAKAPNLFMKIRSGHYQIPDHISYSARSLICSLLSYDPMLRPSAEAVSFHPWMNNPPKHVEPIYAPHAKHHELDQTVPIHKLQVPL